MAASLMVLALAGCASVGSYEAPPAEEIPVPPPVPVPPPPSPVPPEYVDWAPVGVSNGPVPGGDYADCTQALTDRCVQPGPSSAGAARPVRVDSSGRPVVANPNSLIRPGLGAFADPPAMFVDQPASLSFAIGLDRAQLDRQMGSARRVTARSVSVAPKVRVTLQAHDLFEIRAPNGVTRPLDSGRASWQWVVVPKQAGSYVLEAYVEPIAVRSDGAELVLTGYTEPVTVDVDVSPAAQKEQEHKDTLVDMGRTKEKVDAATAILVAVAALIAALGLVAWRLRTFGAKPEPAKA